MADLTEEQKIVIGVCVSLAALIIIGVIIFICCVFHSRERHRHRRRHHYKERIIDYHDKRPYTNGYGPPPFEPTPIPYPLPPPPPIRREVYYTKPRPIVEEVIRQRPVVEEVRYVNRDVDTWSEPPVEKRYYSESRWDGHYRTEPILVPLAKPEVISSSVPRDAEVIYLKYNDDQALLRQTNTVRQSDYGYNAGALRRTRSVHEIRKSSPYVGEWYRRNDNMNEFNEGAARAGRDPFLWKSQRY